MSTNLGHVHNQSVECVRSGALGLCGYLKLPFLHWMDNDGGGGVCVSIPGGRLLAPSPMSSGHSSSRERRNIGTELSLRRHVLPARSFHSWHWASAAVGRDQKSALPKDCPLPFLGSDRQQT